MKPKLRDFRNKQFFQMDDVYINGYARHCGWKATLVYNSLCRHANKDQYSYPSINLIAEELSVSRDTVIEGIKSLEQWNIIYISKTRSKNGIFKNNGYDLLDKSEWKKPLTQVDVSNSVKLDHQVDVSNSVKLDHQVDVSNIPSRRQQLDQVAVVDCKDTHIEGYTYNYNENEKKIKKNSSSKDSSSHQNIPPESLSTLDSKLVESLFPISPPIAVAPPLSSKTSLVACTEVELWNIAINLRLYLPIVKEKHQLILEMIECGDFQRKYPKDKTMYFTLLRWLRMAKERGRIQEWSETEEMYTRSEHPDDVAETKRLIKWAKKEGII